MTGKGRLSFLEVTSKYSMEGSNTIYLSCWSQAHNCTLCTLELLYKIESQKQIHENGVEVVHGICCYCCEKVEKLFEPTYQPYTPSEGGRNLVMEAQAPALLPQFQREKTGTRFSDQILAFEFYHRGAG